MRKQELGSLKNQTKRLTAVQFRTFKRGGLPRPLDKIGGKRYLAAGPEQVAENLLVIFLIRDGETLERRAFYAYLFQSNPSGGLLPLANMHYHPSHKGIHIVLNCQTERNYLDRLLPGAPELAIGTPPSLNPANDTDRLRLVDIFCRRCGITLGEGNLLT
uniref:Uncharacterized protein n=1 Tax=mine drainage metagenome TaxID=410659 RepID=E6QVB8_9ZZZZ